jgi:hypothetical protein
MKPSIILPFIFLVAVVCGTIHAQDPQVPELRQLPSMPITSAIEKAHEFITENDIKIGDRFLSSVRFQEVSFSEENSDIIRRGPSWHLTFEPTARVLGGQLFLSVYMDGTIRHAYGR